MPPKDSLEYEVNLLRKLVAFNTDSETKANYAACADFIAKEARALGFRTEIVSAKAQDKKQRPNVLIYFDNKRKKDLLVVTHFDVVSAGSDWTRKPNELLRKGTKLSGLGAADDKAAIAVCLGALRDLRGKECGKNVKIVVGCDEEVGSEYGIKFLSERHTKKLGAHGCLVMDSKLSHIGIGCSGIVMGFIEFKGTAGHAAYAFRNPNIVHKLVPFLNDLKEYEKEREKAASVVAAPSFAPKKKIWGRFNITILKVGHKTNAIPGSAEIGFDIRALPEENIKAVMSGFKSFAIRLLKKHGLKGIISMTGSNGYFVPKNNGFVKEIAECVKSITGKKAELAGELGATDGRFIARLGIPTVGFGPGGSNPHSAQESITLREIRLSKRVLMKLIRG